MSEFKLQYKVEADTDQIQRKMRDLDGQIDSTGAGFAGSFRGALPAIGAIAAGIGTVTVAAAALGTKLFDLTKEASEFGSTIFDATQKTGLGAVSISSLKVAADQSGASLETITGSIAKFSKAVGAAGDDAKLSAKFLTDFGIKPQEAIDDLDGSLAKVFKRIYDAKPGVEQITLAQKAFGKSGADLIPVINGMEGDFESFRKKAVELGIAIDDEAAAKADAFGDQMDTLNAQLAGVGRTIGFALMPELTRLAGTLSNWLAKNKDEVSEWGARAATTFSRFVTGLRTVVDFVRENEIPLRIAAGVMTAGLSEIQFATMKQQIRLADKLTSPGASRTSSQEGGGGRAVGSYLADDEKKTGSGKAVRPPKETDSEFRKFITDLGFGIERTYGKAINPGSPHTYGGAADVKIGGKTPEQLFMLFAKSLEKGYRVFDERIKAAGVKQTGPHVHIENAKTSLTKESRILGMGFSQEQLAYLKHLDKERLGKASGLSGLDAFTQSEKTKAEQEADNKRRLAELDVDRRIEIGKVSLQRVIDDAMQEFEHSFEYFNADQAFANSEALFKLQMQQIDEEILAIEEKYNAAEKGSEREAELFHQLSIKKIERETQEAKVYKEYEERNDRIFQKDLDRWAVQQRITEELEKQKVILPAVPLPVPEMSTWSDEPQPGKSDWFTKGLFGSLGGSKFETDAQAMESTFTRLGEVGGQAFNSLAGAMGSLVENWVLYGSVSEGAAQKAIASSLAMAASQSTVSAIMETAYGVAALTPWGAAIYGNPAFHFKSAALFGLVAAGTALGGRAIAGDRFQRESGGVGSAGSSSGNSSNYSSQPYSRRSENVYFSGGSSRNSELTRLSVAIERLDGKIETASAGDVFVRGAKANRGFIGRQTLDDVRSSRVSGKEMASAMGFR